MELEGGQKNQHTRHVCTYRNACAYGVYTTMFKGGRRERIPMWNYKLNDF